MRKLRVFCLIISIMMVMSSLAVGVSAADKSTDFAEVGCKPEWLAVNDALHEADQYLDDPAYTYESRMELKAIMEEIDENFLDCRFSDVDRIYAAIEALEPCAERDVTCMEIDQPTLLETMFVVDEQGNTMMVDPVLVKLGDTDKDKKITIKDATAIQKHCAELVKLIDEKAYSGDVDSDRRLTIKDATLIQKYVASIEEKSRVGEDVIYEYWLGYFDPTDNTDPVEDVTESTDGDYTVPVFTEPDATEVVVNYDIVQECRIEGYNGFSDDTEIHIVRSVSEFEAVLELIHGDENSTYMPKPIRDEKYSDEYFEDNALVVSLNVVGGSCCTQEINRLERQGSTLTVYRTRYQPEVVITDMNYQYVLMEVRAEDVANVDCVSDHTDTVILQDGSIDYTIVDECRIEGYRDYDGKARIYLVRSPQEFDTVLGYIEGNENSFFKKPVRDEKYNDEYFKDKALVVSLNLVGGSNCSQGIYDVKVDNTMLIIYRSISKPENVTPDMNYQYVLLEVNARDVARVNLTGDHVNGVYQ